MQSRCSLFLPIAQLLKAIDDNYADDDADADDDGDDDYDYDDEENTLNVV